jgi:hypothetical protein
LGKELGKILDLVKKCPHVLRGFTNLEGLPVDSIVDLVVDEQDEFTALLETFVDSAIFNPVDPADHRANKNFCSLLNTVFSSISTDIDELTPEDLAGVKMVSDYDASGEIAVKGECARIVDVLTSIASTGVLDQLSSATSDNIGSLLKKLDIPATFNAIGASKIFSKLGGGLFDSYLSPILNAEELGLGEKVTFLGDGVPVFKEVINEKLSVEKSFAPHHQSRQKASSVGMLAMEYIKEGKFEDAFSHRPIYLRETQAERERKLREKSGE